ncbi:immunity repressor protein [Anoxybacillus sp. B7M1]|uniref:helix-turn-helix domain-containing protein n=1 Tax=unclassified Anoxybacillus TaxID=2639704 RepID=UPI0005CDC7D8|nr:MULTISPECIES: helix-turn-helix transcriptional regulator [unclassified Anoxybacillus]ANB55809.1 immunity repressor protein [Anoxybacillus sp. B2M1]ANB64112.1 immunity repressor protein [Anoxybacillus sp. B7M1]
MLAQRLRFTRKAKKLTQEELAKIVNTTKGTISNYENGHSTPSNEMLSLLADALDTTTDYLLGRTDNPSSTSKTRLPELSEKDERDIAKRLKKFKEEIEKSDGLAFSGEPLSEEARESLIESIEHIFRMTQRINKKYTPKKYSKDE